VEFEAMRLIDLAAVGTVEGRGLGVLERVLDQQASGALLL
jgi:hypothetical protein